jgi:hypothetical protein
MVATCTAFLLDDPDALLESVEVAFVRSRIAGGWSA